MIKIGSTGEDVKKLQTKLGLNPDGNFGPNTEKAVKEWQTKNGLTPDGIVGEKSLALLGITSVVTPSSNSIDLKKLKGHIPDSVLEEIPEVQLRFNCNTILRLSHFLAQCHHESGGFKAVSENLNYGAEGLLGTFKSDFDVNKDKVLSEAEKKKAYELARHSEPIANFVYANQNGNGDEASGDGWKYRGRGYIQLTGKENYGKFTEFIGDNCIGNPDLVATKYPLASAAFFFNSNKLWSICDLGTTDEVVTKVTKRVNGGTIGLSERIENFKNYYNLLK
jgi:putative chitinase